MESTHVAELFRPDVAPLGGLRSRLASLAQGAAGRLLALRRIEEVYARARGAASPQAFLQAVLEDLGISTRLREQDWAGLPRQGATLVVANHPFGGLEGMILAQQLLALRPDVKVMANYLLGRVPELRELFLLVDPFGGDGATGSNLAPLRQALRWLKDGGLLVVFPAGEVAHWRPSQGRVADPPWSPAAALLAGKAGAAVVPVHFQGRNSLLFQTLGLLNSRLRTAMLPRELANKAGHQVTLTVGRPIAASRYQRSGGGAEATSYLRQRTYLLRLARVGQATSVPPSRRVRRRLARAEAIAPAQGRQPLLAEVRALPPAQTLLSSGDFVVFWARSRQMPALMREIGRQREICFRAVGEGTGRDRDLDGFDDHYLHLCLWNQAEQELAGGYRLGPVEEILATRGLKGLYTSTLFKFAPEFFERLPGALELGRSFIVAQYQRSYSALLLLWKGIGCFVMANPVFRHIFGPVSVSERYHPFSRRLLVEAMGAMHPSPLAELVRPRNPPRFARQPARLLRETLAQARDMDEVSEMVADLEGLGQGAPILFKQYLKLSARCAGWNLDPAFGNALDCLLVADLMEAPDKVMARYCGHQALRAYRSYHGGEFDHGQRGGHLEPRHPKAA
ncbi:MAG: GNAT family N-acyltransferase [Pseudomonadota bacterium]